MIRTEDFLKEVGNRHRHRNKKKRYKIPDYDEYDKIYSGFIQYFKDNGVIL